jgi:hypothetical protein
VDIVGTSRAAWTPDRLFDYALITLENGIASQGGWIVNLIGRKNMG